VHELTIHHAGQITEKIFNLKKMEGVLQEMAAQCNQGNVPKCPIIDSLFDA
jgi:MerR family mercuric resistance operon transcriptional regulator